MTQDLDAICRTVRERIDAKASDSTLIQEVARLREINRQQAENIGELQDEIGGYKRVHETLLARIDELEGLVIA